jgi:NADPH:quinone reductase-like Zn-dependent oxidoreductase
LTAWEGLELMGFRAHENSGEGNSKSILIIGGAGGVGSILTQLARGPFHFSTVIATASRPETEEWCRRNGATHVISHRKPLLEQLQALPADTTGLSNGEVSVVFCCSDAHTSFDQWPGIIQPFGKACVITGDQGAASIASLKRKCITLCNELMFSRPLYDIDMERQGEILAEVATLVDDGIILPTNKSEFPLSQIAEAHELQESGTAIGKIVLPMSEP